jgi:hypothetical protein
MLYNNDGAVLGLDAAETAPARRTEEESKSESNIPLAALCTA